MLRRSYRLPEDSDRVPRDRGGIYQFCLRFPSDYELGLSRPEPNLESVKQHLHLFIVDVSALFGLVGLTGEAHSLASARHLRVAFSLTGRRTDTKDMASRMSLYLARTMGTVEMALMTTSVIRKAFEIAPPVYVGIAANQSLGARLDQHLSGSSHVAKRIHDLGLSWNHFEYRCSPLPVDAGPIMSDLETVIQGLFKPQLSDR